jgi:hypothetical protein
MEPNRLLKAALTIGLAISAFAASAQMIYKQVDEDGKVIFTDQPRDGARTVASYPTPKSGNRQSTDRESAEAIEAPRNSGGELSARAAIEGAAQPTLIRADPIRSDSSRVIEGPRWIEAPVAGASLRPFIEPSHTPGYVEGPSAALTLNSPTPRVRYGEVERAVSSYQPLTTPLAAQVDATESARRARADASKMKEGAPVLIVKPVASDHERLAQKKSLEFFYALWVVTFVLLAGGLLYFGWRVLELIMGRAFPRWHIGVA